jgi:phage baseplate assembly protein W
MKTLLLNQEGDFVLEQGSFLWVEGDEELAQSVRVILQTRLGEWFLNLGLGLDRNTILGKNFNEVEAKSSIIEALAEEPRISGVEEITFTKTGRELSVSLKLLKENGEVLLLTEVI